MTVVIILLCAILFVIVGFVIYLSFLDIKDEADDIRKADKFKDKSQGQIPRIYPKNKSFGLILFLGTSWTSTVMWGQ